MSDAYSDSFNNVIYDAELALYIYIVASFLCHSVDALSSQVSINKNTEFTMSTTYLYQIYL